MKRNRSELFRVVGIAAASPLLPQAAEVTESGFQKLPQRTMPRLDDIIQHGLNRYLWAPVVPFGPLAGDMRLMERNVSRGTSDASHPTDERR
jgi:hypothetical protein